MNSFQKKMKRKTKKEQHIVGMIGIVAIALIISTVLLLNSANLTANATIKYTPTVQKEKDIALFLDPMQPIVECQRKGIEQCKNLYQVWRYPRKTITEDYENCVKYVNNICNQVQRIPAKMVWM